MKKHKIFLILLAISMVALQGCSPAGTWFPKGSATVRKGTYSGKSGSYRPHGSGRWMRSQNRCAEHGKVNHRH